jgi:hypothetical protein
MEDILTSKNAMACFLLYQVERVQGNRFSLAVLTEKGQEDD